MNVPLRRSLCRRGALAAMISALSLWGGVAQAHGTADASPIVIGVDAPLSGAVAYMGQNSMMGATLAAEQINRAGGVLGHPIKLVKADSECTPGPAVSAARYLIDEQNVDAIMGDNCSSAVLAIMKILPRAQVPELVVSATNPKITEMAGVGGNPWVFRLNVSDAVIATSYSKFVAQRTHSIAIFATNDDFGRGAVTAYQASLAPLGVKVVDVEYYDHGTADYRAQLARVQGFKPQALMLVMESGDAAVFVRQFHELHMRQTLFARGSVVSAEFLNDIKDAPSLGNGIMEASLWSIQDSNKLNAAFVAAYQKRWHIAPADDSATWYYGVRCIAKAVRASGQTGPTGIRDGLEKVNYQDGIGPVHFDAHHQAHTNTEISTIVNGKIKLLAILGTQ